MKYFVVLFCLLFLSSVVVSAQDHKKYIVGKTWFFPIMKAPYSESKVYAGKILLTIYFKANGTGEINKKPMTYKLDKNILTIHDNSNVKFVYRISRCDEDLLILNVDDLVKPYSYNGVSAPGYVLVQE